MFVLRAHAKVQNVLSPRSDGFAKSASLEPFRRGDNILSNAHIFDSLSGVYNISRDPKSYVYVVARAVSADVPNSNGDLFPTSEILRFDEHRACPVYRTFVYGPFHENHDAQDRTRALGFILDSAWIDAGREKWVDCLIAIDATKDSGRRAAHDFETGRSPDVSMGCLAGEVECSRCGSIAHSEPELCFCLRSQKMPFGNVYEICRQVVYTELSKVADGADPKAELRQFLGRYASHIQAPKPQPLALAAAAQRGQGPLIGRMGLSSESQVEIGQFWEQHIHRMPRGMSELGGKLFG